MDNYNWIKIEKNGQLPSSIDPNNTYSDEVLIAYLLTEEDEIAYYSVGCYLRDLEKWQLNETISDPIFLAWKPINIYSVFPKNHNKHTMDTIFVDASCSGNPGYTEYRGIEKESNNIVFQARYLKATNNIGEFLAVVHALYLNPKIIYTDSVTAIAWVRQKKCKTNYKENKHNETLFHDIRKAELWLNQNVYTTQILKWDTKSLGEIPADYNKK